MSFLPQIIVGGLGLLFVFGGVYSLCIFKKNLTPKCTSHVHLSFRQRWCCYSRIVKNSRKWQFHPFTTERNRSSLFNPFIQSLISNANGLVLPGLVRRTGVLSGIMVVLFSASLIAGNLTSVQSGTWSNTATWGGQIPGAGDNVTIAHTITSNTEVSCTNLTINAGGSCSVSGTNTLTISGNWVNNGTFNANNSTVVFTGASSIFSGSSVSSFYNCVLNKGTDLSAKLTITSNLTISNLTLNFGVLEITGGTTTINDIVNKDNTIPSTCGFIVAGGTLNTKNFTLENEGLIRIISGTASFGTQSGNSVHTQIDGAFEVAGGNVFVAGRLENTAGGYLVKPTIPSGLNITGGTITIGTVGNELSSKGTLDVSSNGAFKFSGGTIIFQNSSTATTPLDIALIFGSGNGTKNTTGGTFQFGNGSTPVGALFRTKSEIPIDNLIINSNSSVRIVNNDLIIGNKLTMSGGNIDATSERLILSNPSITSLVRTSGLVTGKMQRAIGLNGGFSYLFPVGNGANYTPLTLNFAGLSTAGNITVESVGGIQPNIGSSLLNNSKTVNTHWNVLKSGVSFTSLGIDFSFPAVPGNSGSYRIGMYNGSTWSYPSVSSSSTTTAGFTGLTSLDAKDSFAIAECLQPTITLGMSPAICQGSTSAGLPYTSTNSPTKYRINFDATANSAGLTDINLPTALPASSMVISVPVGIAPDTYNGTVYVQNVVDCESIGTSFTLTINPIPVVSATPVSQTICSDLSTGISLTSQVSGATFSWTVTQRGVTGAINGSGSFIAQQLTVTGQTPGTVTYTITPTANGCSGTPVNVAVKVNPNASIVAVTGNNSLCINRTTPYTATAFLGGGTGTWSSSNSSVATVDSDSGLVTGISAGTATITYSISGGCSSAFAEKSVTIEANPNATIRGTDTVCLNTSAPVITFSNPRSTGETITYNINGGSNLTVNVEANATATVSAPTGTAGTYTYNLVSAVYQTGLACSNNLTGSATITVVPVPSCSVAGQATVFAGTAYTYTSTPVPADQVTHVWSITGNGTISGTTTSSTVNVVAGAPGTYTLRDDINRLGCTSFCTYTVTVISPCDISPVVGSVSNTTSTVFTATAGMDIYSWSVSGNGSIPSGVTNSRTVTVLSGTGCTSYTVAVSLTKNGITSSCTQTVSVVDTTAPGYTVSPTTAEFCVINIQSAVMSLGTLQVTPAPASDYVLFKHGTDTSLDLNMANATDNCCSSGLTIRWEIHFSSGQATVSGTGQPSAYTSDIQLWGDGTNNQVLTHEIWYWIKDCNGNEMTSPIKRTINIQPRPKITTN